MTVARVPALEELIHRLDEAVAVRDDAACCRRVKQVLTDVIGRGERFICRTISHTTATPPTSPHAIARFVWYITKK